VLDSVQHCRRIDYHFRSGMSENGDASAPAPVVDRDLHPYSIQAFLIAIHFDDLSASRRSGALVRITRHSEKAAADGSSPLSSINVSWASLNKLS
jgi:hypothetical protein